MPSKSPNETYRQAAIKETGSLQRLIGVYSVAIESGINREPDTMKRAIALLRKTLDYGADPAIALSLERLYRQCEYHIDTDEIDHAVAIFENLRTLWLNSRHR